MSEEKQLYVNDSRISKVPMTVVWLMCEVSLFRDMVARGRSEKYECREQTD